MKSVRVQGLIQSAALKTVQQMSGLERAPWTFEQLAGFVKARADYQANSVKRFYGCWIGKKNTGTLASRIEIMKPTKINLTFEDLFLPCETCNGSGEISESEQQSCQSSVGPLGVGPVIWSGPCSACSGKGGDLTTTGDAIMKLVERLGRRPR